MQSISSEENVFQLSKVFDISRYEGCELECVKCIKYNYNYNRYRMEKQHPIFLSDSSKTDDKMDKMIKYE